MHPFIVGNRRKIVSVLALASIAIASLAYTQYVLNSFMEQERASVSLWAKAIEYNSRELYPESRLGLQQIRDELAAMEQMDPARRRQWDRALENSQTDLANAALDFVSDLIIENRSKIPSIVVDSDGRIINWNNLDERRLSGNLIVEFAAMNPPIEIPVMTAGGGLDLQYVYYGQSAVIQSLRFFPFVQFGLIAIFLGLVYSNLLSIRRTEQSNLWVGMAKEAAHQLGTPLSSMYGWIELLRSSTQERESLKIVYELEEDIRRLQNVADRFSKIGSEAELKVQRIEPILASVIEYMERRLPRFRKNVSIRREIDDQLKVPLNAELFTWAIENIMKNALDAIDYAQENAYIDIRAHTENGELIIDVEDNGRGIEKGLFEEIFMPGFSTKKRGWGLGLSLARRIIHEYHKGKVSVLKSSPGAGTVIRIRLPMNR